jgi:hypothetical protein
MHNTRKPRTKTGINWKQKTNAFEYHRAYWHLIRKPFSGCKDNFAEGRYVCPLCGFSRRLTAFNSVRRPSFKVIRSGHPKFEWIIPDFKDARVLSIQKSYIATLVARCREFLAMYDPDFRDLLRSQEIRREFGGSDLSLPSFSSYQNQMTLHTNIKANSGLTIITPEIRR